MITKEEIRVMPMEIKECQQPPGARRAKEGLLLPWSLQREDGPADNLNF